MISELTGTVTVTIQEIGEELGGILFTLLIYLLGSYLPFRFLCITTCFLPVFEVLPIFCLTNSCFYTFFQGCIIGNDVVFALATSVGTRRSTLRTRSHLRSVTRPRIRATEFHSYYRYSWLAGRSFAGVGFRSC